MKTRKTNRMLALFISLCMVVGMLPMTGMTFAAEPCPNHAAHDDSCGFVQTVEGHECGHAHDDTCGYAEGMGDAPCKHEQGEHDESCGYAPPSEEAPCGHTHNESCGEPDENGEYPGCAHEHDGGCGYAPASEGTPCAHQEHDEDCGYGEAKEGAACRHKHDADCGYIAAVEGTPCGHACELCDGSEAENALPLGEEPAATYSISGLVQDNALNFLSGISVTLWKDGKQVGGVNTDDILGNYSFTSLAPGTYTVKAGGWSRGVYYTEKSQTVTITDSNRSCDFFLEPGNAPDTYSIYGQVRDHDHQFLPGISVALWQDGEQVGGGNTDVLGNYSFTSLAPGTYTVKASGWLGGVYYTAQSQTVTITDSNRNCGFFLQPGNAPGTYSVSGAVRQEGQLFSTPGIPVELWQDGRQIGVNSTVLDNMGIQGTFGFSNISPGTYTLRVPAGFYDGTYYLESTYTFTLENFDITRIQLDLNPGAVPGSYAVTGAVKGAGGAGLSGVPVFLMKGDVKRYEATTGANGGYSFSDVSEGTYTLKIPAGTYSGTAYLEATKAITVSGQNLSVDLMLNPAPVPPGAPQELAATPGYRQVVLSWKAPASDGGAEISGYQVSEDNGANWTNATNATGHTVTGLNNGQSYTFQVRALNSAGVGAAATTTATLPTTPPGAPIDLAANVDENGSVTITWKTPYNGGSEITGYWYSVRREQNPPPVTPVHKIPGSDASTTSYTLPDDHLVEGETYIVQLHAETAKHPSGLFAQTSFVAPVKTPSAPQELTATPGDQQVTLKWKAPQQNGAAVTKYQYAVTPGGEGWKDVPGDGSATGHTVTGLNTGQSYTFQVRAVNSAGTGVAASVTAIPLKPTFTLTVENGTDITGSGPYAEGAKVNIRANVPKDGKLFEKWTSSGGGSFDDANSSVTTFTMPAEAVTVTAIYEDDKTAPTGTITVKDNGWSKFWNTITFGVFFKETQEVTISAQDDSGQDVAIAYHVANAALTLEQVKALAGGQWTAYTDQFSITPNTELVIYTRLTDKAGNVTYISSNGIVLDNTPPAFSLEGGKTYDSAQTLTVTDNYALASVKLGEAEQLPANFSGTENALSLDTNGTYTIEATDKAGNTASITVTIDIPVATVPNLTGITAPTAITGVANGTPLAEISLPDKVAITTTKGDKQAGVTWNRNVPAYNPASETAQTFTISGTVTLPDGVTNTNGVSLTVTISVTVEAKETVSITGLEITSNPNKTAYAEGEALDLTGLSVKLTFSDGSDKTVALVDFAANNITATPANGAKLSLSNTTVTVSTGGKSAGFPITVNAMQQVQTPSFSPAGGAYEAAQEVEIACGTPGAKIYYTTDGSAPTANSTLYAGPITVSKTTTINAIAIKDGMKNSAVATDTYTINTTPPPVITVPGAPRSFKATPGDKRVILSWTPPQSNGGAEITKYEVSKDNGVIWENATSATGHTFTGLANGQSYTFQVRAVNSKGAGAEASVTATPSSAVYHLTVTNGRDITDSGPYQAGARVRIQADAATSGWTFDKWTGGANGIFDSGSRTSFTTTITMPAGDVAVTATYKKINAGGGSSTGGGSSSGSGNDSANDSAITAPKSNYTVTGDKISQTISRTNLKKLADDRKSLTLNSGKASMTFSPAALKAILAAVPATAGNITFAAAPADISAFPEAAKLIGNRPVFNYTVSYKDSEGNTVNVNANFPASSVSISMNYTPAEGEVTGNLFMVYVDGKGAVTWLDKSSYSSGKVLADVPHFSIYGVAYKAPAAVFTDITGHWAKADMEFVAARGLLSGTGEKVFSPDAAMTRGMFVTALGRLAGVNPASYQTRSFTDVKADAYYAAYVEWAAQKNIAGGTGEGLFSPDTTVTREQMAVMMTNYAGQMGYSIPTPLAAVTFADNDKISAWAAKEVAAMQRAGIIKGKDGNRFDPQGNATRAEVSAVLRRFVEIVIDPVTAQGWGKNDSGQWLYYKDGKAITGWKQLGGKWYYFDKNGIMAVNTKVDGYEIGPDGARKENN